MKISSLRHPEYNDDSADFDKWRLTYKGGRNFINRFLVKFSQREDDTAFIERRNMAHCPAYAKIGINKLKNTFYSRMSEIVRDGGPSSYINACRGEGGGVDLYGSSMNTFIGQEVLGELMTMKRVGVYIDRHPTESGLLSNNLNNDPYLYTYKVEDIFSWDYEYYQGEYVYTNILLRDTCYVHAEDTSIVCGVSERYRHIWLGADRKVHIQFYKKCEDEDDDDIKDGDEIVLDLTRIPFVLLSLQESLLIDVADYQVSLLNLASSDTNYVNKANFPFYTEQYDPKWDNAYLRKMPIPRNLGTDGKDTAEGTKIEAQRTDADEVTVGSLKGRKYPIGAERPEFIAPPAEPLLASMKKQEQMKIEIFELIDIAASNAQPTHASAESKQLDDRGLESGLSNIGLELEYAEREIAKIWAMYENKESATIKYPTKYQLKSDGVRIEEATALDKIKTSAPSKTFAKEVSKQITRTMLADKIDNKTLDTIVKEIDDAEYITSDPEVIRTASELGMCDAVTGSNALGFDGAKVVPTAQKEHAERLAIIAKSQADGAARGVPDKAPGAGNQEQKDNEKVTEEKPAMGGES